MDRVWQEVASWQLLTEIARRHPKLWLIEAHPGGGQYHCLWLVRSGDQGPILSVNRGGSIHVHPSLDKLDHGWSELAIRGPFGMARRLGTVLDLTIPASPPAWNRRTLAYGVVTGLLSRASAEPRDMGSWEARSGYEDTSGHGGGVRGHFFEGFGAAHAHLAEHHAHDLLAEPGYRFWFVLQSGVPVAAIETSGLAWTRRDEELDLWALLEQHGGDVAPLVAEAWDRITS